MHFKMVDLVPYSYSPNIDLLKFSSLMLICVLLLLISVVSKALSTASSGDSAKEHLPSTKIQLTRGYYRVASTTSATPSTDEGNSNDANRYPIHIEYAHDVVIPAQSPSLRPDFFSIFYPGTNVTDPSFFLSQVFNI